MSAKRKPATAEGVRSDYQQVIELMREVGSKHGFDPIPPDQYKWAIVSNHPRLIRAWAWMLAHTIAWGHRTAYATDKDGKALNLDHMNGDLEFDASESDNGRLSNTRLTWKEGVALGLWRNGTAKEGPRRLYLCGEVKLQAIADCDKTGEETAKILDCTYCNREPCVCFPPYILLEIQDWPEEKRKNLRMKYAHFIRVRKDAHAELMLAFRDIIDQLEDTTFQSCGLEKKRLPPREEKGEAAEAGARRQRIAGLSPSLQQFIQTVEESVQSREETVYIPPELSVQTASAGPTLLCSEITEITERNSSSSSAVSVTVSQPKAEEEEPSPLLPAKTEAAATFAEFRRLYPVKRFDGSKARPLFEALAVEAKRNCIERLQVYVHSPRWQQTPRYIPLASNWLQTAYDEAPPPLFDHATEKAESNAAGNGSGRKSFRDGVDQAFNRRVKDWGLG